MRTDLDIQHDVMTELKWQPYLTAANIGVAVKNGIVTLSGNVDNYSQKMAAERAAKKVVGVRAIAEDIQIGVSPDYKRTDAEIAESALNALRWHSAVPADKINVKVEDGVITLEGTVDWEYQRASAKLAVSDLLSVRDVISFITLNPKTAAKDLKEKITAALHRSATVDAARIKVDVQDSKAILKGMVRSYSEKEDAEEAASCAPGISKVESYLYVEPQLELAF